MFEGINELIAIDDNATFFTDVMLYAILSDHNRKNLYSPELTDILLSNRLPAVVKEFIGRNDEIKECDGFVIKYIISI